MEKFLSIGDVAKIKGITPKALRYYEQIGILIPAYVNQETGYRYYTNDQLVILDLILTCVDFDIPLKEFKTYITAESNIDLKKFLEDSSRIVDEKIKNLQYKKDFLTDLSANAERSNRIKSFGETFTEYFPERYFLTTPSQGDFSNYGEISTKYSELFYQCRSLNSSDGFNQGLIFLHEQNQLAPHAFLQVSKLDVKPDNLYTVPAGEFVCEVVSFEQLEDVKKNIPDLIIKELIELTISPHKRFFEIQRPIIDNTVMF